jgi:ribulose 1,5-bisphosphate synthetase/thiazole synthase
MWKNGAMFSLLALIALAAATSSSSSSSDYEPGSNEKSDYDIVLVGGGMGNVAAAYWLSDMMQP